MGFVLSSTAVIMKMLDERGEAATPAGQRAVSILLLEDLAIIPLLALVAFLSIAQGSGGEATQPAWVSVLVGLGAIAALVAAGRWALNPMFRVVAALGGRDVMTAAALLVVLGAALWMQLGGLSAAMGAFLAGVLLSESSFRHQLEADVEPFRGILLGLFFIAVGMSLDVAVIAENWRLVAVSVIAFTILKAAGVYGVARAFGSSHREATERTVLMTQGGEFAFVLYAAALSVGLIDPASNAILTAIIILSMAMTPLFVILHDRLLPREIDTGEDLERPDGQSGSVLLIGFGRFGQVVSQPLLARGYSITTIDTDPEMIRAAANFGFKVHFGDGTRLDILHAAGIHHARAVVIAVDDREAATRIARLVREEFPFVQVLARAYDRGHAIELIRADAGEVFRETFESALALGRRSLILLGEEPEVVDELMEDVRRRDAERLTIQMNSGIYAGTDLLLSNRPEGAVPRPVPREAIRNVSDGTAAQT
jgi:voltage-gated potassium channel Kch